MRDGNFVITVIFAWVLFLCWLLVLYFPKNKPNPKITPPERIIREYRPIWETKMRWVMEEMDVCDKDLFHHAKFWARLNDSIMDDDMFNSLVIREQEECSELQDR